MGKIETCISSSAVSERARARAVSDFLNVCVVGLIEEAAERYWSGTKDLQVRTEFLDLGQNNTDLLVAISRKTAGEASVTNECVLIQYGALSSSPSDQAKKAEKQLRISGVEVTFEGLVPKGFAERTKVISEALDKAFARPI